MNKNNSIFIKSRRSFIKKFTIGVGTTFLGAPLLSFGSEDFPKKSERKSASDKLGIALVGLGQYSSNMLAPALQETEHCYLAGIVTGTPSKAEVWKEKYNIPDKNIYNYENFDEIADNPDIDIVYVVLPISMHEEFTTRAAKAKKHVICEKPMALNAEQAQRMVDACKENDVKLAIGYRLHFEPFNQRSMELGQKKILGEVKHIKAINLGDKTGGNLDVWRLRKDLAGGGPLMDLGIYCVQAACYTLGKLPVAVKARFGEITEPKYFYEVEQSVSWEMEFNDGIVAECESSYADSGDALSVEADNGSWKISPAFGYDGKKGETSEGTMNFPNVYEQVNQMNSQALSFKNNEESIVPGEMGVRDMKVIDAIYQSARNDGERIELDWEEADIEAQVIDD